MCNCESGFSDKWLDFENAGSYNKRASLACSSPADRPAGLPHVSLCSSTDKSPVIAPPASAKIVMLALERSPKALGQQLCVKVGYSGLATRAPHDKPALTVGLQDALMTDKIESIESSAVIKLHDIFCKTLKIQEHIGSSKVIRDILCEIMCRFWQYAKGSSLGPLRASDSATVDRTPPR